MPGKFTLHGGLFWSLSQTCCIASSYRSSPPMSGNATNQDFGVGNGGAS